MTNEEVRAFIDKVDEDLKKLLDTRNNERIMSLCGWYFDKIWSLVAIEEITCSRAREKSAEAVRMIHERLMEISNDNIKF